MIKSRLIAALAATGLATTAIAAGDLDLMGVNGPVAEIVTETIDDDNGFTYKETLKFDANGMMVDVNGQKPGIARAADGVMKKVMLKEEDEDGEPLDYTATFTIGKGGLVASVAQSQAWGDWTESFTWDADRRLKTRKSSDQLNGTMVYVYTYDPAKIDDHGNWTERKVTCDGVVQHERRTITYR